ncbi:MAG: hypothetical protein B7Y12_04630 [Rhizobiales bacterium 24-66-13]|nr:MAG: hypothetical protein B7Y95_02795 [Rhizobiales bacterium 32-66-11]OYY88654.1 MAG: hypothetical protein B7Y61_01625 [Rhizobiales bacterium 35-66-30]OYZ82158.1 MAG: hypothetical protein B7Y12_04630 [Rhizobiales bacterium 24-66-13]OZB07864.1 MAG: hypothetical protein B7X67_08520 [Rhizobiales bacterium 39-66-18]
MSLPPSPSLAASRARTNAGWLFAASFRPLFVGASALAAASVPLWVFMFLSGVSEVGGMPSMAWHAHEMVFGFLPAVMAGYLFSATPNWSGKLPASGRPLALLFAIWVAGRLVPLVAPLPVALAADAAFSLAVTAALLREARLKPPKQSHHGLMLFPVLMLAAVAHRLVAQDHELATTLARIGVAVAVLLISAVGGRLLPSLTRNALAARGEKVPEPYGRYDVFVLVLIFPALVTWAAAPASPAAAMLMGASAVLQAIRLLRWRGWLVRRVDVAALHAGYLWLVVGTGLAALAAEPLALVPPDVALHVFTAGAIGTMTMAVMARLSTTRGVGMRASASLCSFALVAVNLAAVARAAAPMLADGYVALLVASAVLWALAWTAFLAAQLMGSPDRP